MVWTILHYIHLPKYSVTLKSPTSGSSNFETLNLVYEWLHFVKAKPTETLKWISGTVGCEAGWQLRTLTQSSQYVSRNWKAWNCIKPKGPNALDDRSNSCTTKPTRWNDQVISLWLYYQTVIFRSPKRLKSNLNILSTQNAAVNHNQTMTTSFHPMIRCLWPKNPA